MRSAETGRARRAALGLGRTAVVAVSRVSGGRYLPRPGARQLAGTAWQQRRDVRAAGRLRLPQRQRRLHPRRRDRRRAQRDARPSDGDVRVDRFIASGESSPGQASGFSRTTVSGQQGLATQLANVSDATGGEERVAVYTTLLEGRIAVLRHRRGAHRRVRRLREHLLAYRPIDSADAVNWYSSPACAEQQS